VISWTSSAARGTVAWDLFLQGTMVLNIRFVVLYSKEFYHVNA
jgi:hypothetical protein